MSRRRLLSLPLALLAALIAVVVLAGAASAKTELHARLRGFKEVPGPGDPNGRGTARVVLRPRLGEVCFRIQVYNIQLPATGAHIHEGGPGEAGPIVVALTSPDRSGRSRGCLTGLETGLLRDIARHPRQYYVNVHNIRFPAGAVRGQLRY